MNNLLISSAPQPSGNVASASQQDGANGANDQSAAPFAKVLANKVDKSSPPASKTNSDSETSDTNAAALAQDQVVVPPDALNAILAQIPVETRNTNVADRLAQLASGDRSAAALDPAAMRMEAAPLATGVPMATSTATKADASFQTELSSQGIPSSPLTGMKAADNSTAPLATSEQQLLADALRQNASNRQELAATSPQLATPQISAATISQAAVAAMTGNSAANQTSTTTQSIATPLASPAWGEDFSQKISWMVSQKNQVAELHLNPPNLGPLDVVLKISDNQATALFASPHAAVRDAVESALPKLRELLADNGIMLSNATVGDQSPRDRGQGEPAHQNASAFSGSGSADDTGETRGVLQTSSTVQRHNGMVDTFA